MKFLVINKQCGGFGMLVRWARKYVCTMRISIISTELRFLQGHKRKPHYNLYSKNGFSWCPTWVTLGGNCSEPWGDTGFVAPSKKLGYHL